MNAGREHLSAVVTENATEDKALGKLRRTDEDICYWTSGVSKGIDEEEALLPYCLMKKLKIKSFALPAAFLENTCLDSMFIFCLCLVSFYLGCYLQSSRLSPTLKPDWKN